MFYAINLFISFVFIFSLGAGEFYAILVGDTSDPAIATTVKYDVKLMKTKVQEFAKYSDQPLHLSVFLGDKANSQLILSHLSSLNVGKDDVVLFYQSSHGFHSSLQEDPWPILCYEDHNYLLFAEINEVILNKNGRLLISIADACNNIVEGLKTPFIEEENFIFSKKLNKDKVYKKLFKTSRGSVIICGAKPGFRSYCDTKAGGLLTRGFLEAISQTIHQSKVTWNSIMKATVLNTQKHAEKLNVEQTPLYKVSLVK